MCSLGGVPFEFCKDFSKPASVQKAGVHVVSSSWHYIGPKFTAVVWLASLRQHMKKGANAAKRLPKKHIP